MSALALRPYALRTGSATLLIGATLACCHDPAHATDGYFDPTWAGGGHITFPGDLDNPSSVSLVEQITLESNGNLLLGGIATGGVNYWWLGELLPGGTAVQTFGASNGNGTVSSCHLSAALCSASNEFSAFALQSDGRIVVLGPGYLVRTTPQAHALDIAGVAGGLGYVAVATQINNVQGKLKYGTGLAQAASGKWLVAGGGYYSQATSSNIDFVAIRVNADFSLDQTFNSVVDANNVTFAGGALVAFDIGGSNPDAAEAVVVQSDGRIVLAGTATTGSSNVALTRLSSTGALDLTFGGSGTGKITGPAYYPLSTLADRAGRMLFALGAPMIVARVNADGTPDNSFGTQGVSTQSIGSCVVQGSASGVAVDSAGRILVAGFCDILNNGTPVTVFLVERLHGDDGSLDTSFGVNGFTFGAFDTLSQASYGNAVAFDASGHPIIGGRSGLKAGVARLTYDLAFTNDFEFEPRGRIGPTGE
jgi:uncharacterized delta-60 repeat protein